jgi:hypothetical protein
MSTPRELAYRIDPALWVREVLRVEPAPWQEQFLRAPKGASIIALTARQVGKTTTAAWAIAHDMLFRPGGLSVIACPAHRQSGEAVRRIREILILVGAEFRIDNVYALELKNGSRVLALPSSDDSIRGLTVDGWIVADEAAQLSNDLIAALSPMRAASASPLCHAVDGLEPHRPVLDGLGRRRPVVDAAEGHRRQRDVLHGRIPGAAASFARRA